LTAPAGFDRPRYLDRIGAATPVRADLAALGVLMRAHLDRRGFADVEMNVSGGYDPTETAEDSRLVRAQIATYAKLGVQANLNVRLAGSWPGGAFTQPPVSVPVSRFGLGTGANAHAPDEYYVIDSIKPKVAGLVDATMGYAEFLYTLAAIK
jgi:acetylornithine deacetylase/succinyl-diaminopimelate desuccinylase-like protein